MNCWLFSCWLTCYFTRSAETGIFNNSFINVMFEVAIIILNLVAWNLLTVLALHYFFCTAYSSKHTPLLLSMYSFDSALLILLTGLMSLFTLISYILSSSSYFSGLAVAIHGYLIFAAFHILVLDAELVFVFLSFLYVILCRFLMSFWCGFAVILAWIWYHFHMLFTCFSYQFHMLFIPLLYHFCSNFVPNLLYLLL